MMKLTECAIKNGAALMIRQVQSDIYPIGEDAVFKALDLE